MSIVRPFVCIVLSTVRVHSMNGETAKRRGYVCNCIIHTAVGLTETCPASLILVGCAKSPASKDSIGTSATCEGTEATNTYLAEATVYIKTCFTTKALSCRIRSGICTCIAIKTLFQLEAYSISIPKVLNTLNTPTRARVETALHLNFSCVVLNFRNYGASVDNTVKGNVRSSKCNARSGHDCNSDKCFFHLSSTPIEVIKLAESSNS